MFAAIHNKNSVFSGNFKQLLEIRLDLTFLFVCIKVSRWFNDRDNREEF